MKELTKKKIVKLCGLLKVVKEIFVFSLYIFIIVFYYYICCMYIYNIFNNDSCELINVCTINLEELKPVSQRNIWYKYILDDFFNSFTSNSKTINPKFIEVKSDIKTIMPLKLEHNISIVKKSIILDKIKDDYMESLISECEYYKYKISLLEIQILKAKISFQDLIKDISGIVKEIPNSSKKS